MKRKHFILALVAMLCSAFSVNAQTTVSTAADLKAALTTGGEVTLGANIELTEMIVVPAGVTATLDLNGKAITVPEATDTHIYAIDNQGVLTLKDEVGGGSVTSRGIYNGYNGNAENAKLTIESGKYIGMDNGGAAIFNGAELVIYGGEIHGYRCAVDNALETANTTINGGTFGGFYKEIMSTSYIIRNDKGNLVINDADVISGFGAVGCYGGTTVINDGNFLPTGWAGYTCHVVYVAENATVTIKGGTFKMNYPADAVPDSGSAVASYYNGTLTISGGSFTAHFDNVSPVELSAGSEITGGSYYNHTGEASTHSYVTNYIKDGYELGEDGSIKATFVAKVGDDAYFGTLQDALDAATDGQTVTLLTGITLTDADMVKIEGKYNVMMNVSGKDITLDLNEKTINIDYNGGQYLYAAVFVADGAGLTVTGNGKIDIAENGINVAYMFWKRGTTGHLTIENGTFHMDDSGDSMVYTNGDEIVTVNGGTFTIDNIDTRPNQFPCIFNAAGQNTANIIVNGGTFNDDVAHQYYPFEVMMPRTKALQKSESENLWTLVDAVAYVAEKEGLYTNEVGYATFDEAWEAAMADEATDIVIGLLTDVTFDYNARDAYGTTETTSLTINGNGNTLTLNQKNSDWASIGLANAEAKLVLNNMIIEKTGYGDTSGAWNTHAIIFSCPVEMTDVTVNNGIAVQAGATLNNVTINEANGYYGLWVNGNGQAVTMNGGAINATNGGRGIKVADQYIDAPAQVTLNVTGTTFNTAKKAAVLVSSTAGAKVTANEVDITNVAEDNTNFVWVDEDWAAYYNSVKVYDEATKGQENEASFPIKVWYVNGEGVASSVRAYYKNLDDLFAAPATQVPGSNKIELFGNVTAANKVDVNYGSNRVYSFVTNVAEGVTMTFEYADNWNMLPKFDLGENITLNVKKLQVIGGDIEIAGTIVTDYLYLYGTGEGVTITETGSVVATTGDATVQVKGGTVLTVNGNLQAGTLNVWTQDANDSELIVSGTTASATIDHLHAWNGEDGVSAQKVNVENGATLTATNFQADRGSVVTVADATVNSEKITLGYGDNIGKLVESGNSIINGPISLAQNATVESDGGLTVTTDVADHKVIFDNGQYKVVPKEYVAQIGETKYESLHEAMVAAKSGETVLLISDVNLAGTEWEPVSFKGTFDGQNFTISNLTINKPGVQNTGFITSLNGTFKNVTFTNPTVTGGEGTAVVAGRAGGSASLAENITINGTIKVETTHSGYARAAAIVGGWAYGNYKNITVDGTDKEVSYIKHTGGGDGRYVAGIVGHADDVNSYETCVVKNITISGGWLCGGIAGPGPSDGLATGCAVENINVNADYSGGMFGWYYGDGTIENSTITDVTFTDGSTNNGPIGGYSNNPEANVSNVTITNVKNADGAPLLSDAVAVNGKGYASLAAAITAAQANDVITFLTDINESVTVNKSVTIDGAGKTLTGKITTKGSSATLRITIQNINFDGNNEIDYAVKADNNSKFVIENCSVDNYTYGFLYVNSTNDQISVKDVTVKNANYGAHLVSFNKATFENVTVENGTYGVMVQNQGSRNIAFNNCTMTNVTTPLSVWEKGTANVTFAFEGTNEMGVEQLSSSQYAVYKNAAMVGTTIYGDLNDAAAAASANGTVTLLGNMTIESDLNNAAKGLVNIAADAQVTIDLNGKTIDVTDKSTGNFIVFYNYGVLTIKNGTVNLVAENNREWNAQSTIILNRGGELTIESGTYTHLGGSDMAFALDNSGNSFGDAYATIVDGTLESTYTAIRNRMADPALNGNPGNGIAELEIKGGLIKGVKRGVWGQITNASSDFLGSLTVTGGTIEAADAIRMDADSHENITVDISGDAVIKGNLAGDYADYNVTGGTFYNEVEEDYLAWGYQLVGDTAPYTVEYTGKVSELTLVDSEFDEFVNEQEVTVGTLTYERTMPAAGVWQALYVPFEIPVATLSDLGYEVAYLYDVHNEVVAGEEIDPTKIKSIHFVKITQGTLRANYPYIIRPTESADLNLALTLNDAKLYSTAASAMNSVESSTTTTRYIFAGTYTKANRATLTGDDNIPCYAMLGGEWFKMSSTASLKPFRVFMYIVNKDGSPVIVGDEAALSIKIRVIGEENEDGTTTIYDVEYDEPTTDYIYDLQGRRVLEPQKGSLYIINGKKVVF